MRWLAILTGGLLIGLCLLPWVTITIKGEPLTVSGFHSDIFQFGKPGLFFLFVTIPCFLFLLINRIWSIRIAFFASALNIAWSVRNYFILSGCSGGNCPEVHPALYIIIVTAVLFTIFVLFAGNYRENRAYPDNKSAILWANSIAGSTEFPYLNLQGTLPWFLLIFSAQ